MQYAAHFKHGLVMYFVRDSFCLSAISLSQKPHHILDSWLLSVVTRFACDIGQSADI